MSQRKRQPARTANPRVWACLVVLAVGCVGDSSNAGDSGSPGVDSGSSYVPGQYNLMLDVTTSTCGSTGVPVGTTHSDVMTVTVAGGVATEVISDLGGSCNQSTITGESVVWSCVATDGTGDMANLQISATFSAGGFSGTAVVTGVSPDILGNKAGSPCSANFSLTGTRQ